MDHLRGRGSSAQRPKRILYIGTYERDYPRNVTVIAAMRRAGFDVREEHRAVWSADGDKSALVASPGKLVGLGVRLCVAYVSLIWQLFRSRSDVDLIAFGYIGQLDALVLGPIARLLGKPILFNPLVTLTDTLVEDRRRLGPDGVPARVIRLIDRISLRLASVVIVDTAENRQFLVSNFGVSDAGVRIVPVGADDRLFHPQANATEATSGGSKLRILFYGNMIPLQGVDTIVRAAHLLRDDPDVTFEIVGAGQVLDTVRSLADDLDVDNVNFTPRLPYHQLPSEIARADVLLGIFGDTSKAGRVVPNKVYQAMAMGAAIITRDSAAARELLRDGESALLIPPADPDALAIAIRRLRDPALRERLGAAARARYVSAASIDVQSSQLEEAIDGLFCQARAAASEVTA